METSVLRISKIPTQFFEKKKKLHPGPVVVVVVVVGVVVIIIIIIIIIICIDDVGIYKCYLRQEPIKFEGGEMDMWLLLTTLFGVWLSKFRWSLEARRLLQIQLI